MMRDGIFAGLMIAAALRDHLKRFSAKENTT